MNKKLLAILTAGLLLLTFTACNEDPAESVTTGGTDTKDPDSYIVVGTDESGNPVAPIEPDTNTAETDPLDPSEENPTFTDVSKKVVVISSVATVRSSTQVLDNNGVGWPSEGKQLDVTGESTNWYRINYSVSGTETTCYISKSVVADAAGLEGFTVIENGEEVEVTVDAVNVRSYPSASSDLSIRFTLKLGDKVTRVAVNENWSRIRYEVVSETETDADGNAVVETKEYYISNDCLKVVGSAATDAEETTVAAE